ncbi:hypothetical protein KJ849_08230 [bacterium]|nr:hypothetical protein [bacterium]
MWSYFKLKKEPNLSINPLVREEELTFFIDREKEIDELNLYLSGDIAQNVLISGRVGVEGLKRSALNKKLADLEEKKVLGKGSEGKRTVYRTTSKRFWLKKMYEATRL